MSFDIINMLRAIADIQFGSGAGTALVPDDAIIKYSKKTGRPRYLYDSKGKLLATLKPDDGMFALTLEGAKRILKSGVKTPNIIVVKNPAAPYVARGKTLFAKFVKKASRRLRASSEVILVDENGSLLGVGRAILNGEEMLSLSRGVAVKVRRGVKSVSNQDG